MPVSERRLAVLIAAALLAPVVAWADYKAYARGQEAAEKQDWGAVETAMQEALADNPTPKVRVKLYGQRFAPYVPHYYLGLAAYKQNDCAGAMRWFGDAAAAAVIAQLSEFKGVADTARGDCSAKLALAAPSKPPPTAATSSTAAAVSPPAPVKPPTTTTPAPPLVPTKPQPSATAATTTTVPTALQGALQHWLGGRYRNVVSASLAGAQGKALAHLHLSARGVLACLVRDRGGECRGASQPRRAGDPQRARRAAIDRAGRRFLLTALPRLLQQRALETTTPRECAASW